MVRRVITHCAVYFQARLPRGWFRRAVRVPFFDGLPDFTLNLFVITSKIGWVTERQNLAIPIAIGCFKGYGLKCPGW